MRREGKRIGVWGWLGLLIVWMVALRPLAGGILWKQMHSASLREAAVAERSTAFVNSSMFWLVFLGVAALSIYGGLRLWRDRTQAAVTAAIWILWITAPMAGVALLISHALFEGQVGVGDALYNVGVNMVVAALWTAYLKRSTRVRQTYR